MESTKIYTRRSNDYYNILNYYKQKMYANTLSMPYYIYVLVLYENGTEVKGSWKNTKKKTMFKHSVFHSIKSFYCDI